MNARTMLDVEAVRERADILAVVGDYVQLKKAGHRHIGLCPFHSEKTPSFSVSQERGVFHCFGCGQGGDVFTFIQWIEKVDFPEAVRILAERFQVPVDTSAEISPDAALRKEIMRLCRVAEEYFVRVLQSEKGHVALGYLGGRGITAETLAFFRVGFAPSGSRLLKIMNARGIKTELLEKAGLVIHGDRGFFDRFRERIVFPIRDYRGRTVGFGGRVLGSGTPKYLNSPETPVFSKGRLLYGLDLAGEAIRREHKVFVVEGYLDVLTLHQAGIQNVVASLGTAFTPEHARLLGRYASDLYLAYDADTAGQSAVLKGLTVLKDSGLRVHIIQLPKGEDPDSFVKNSGAEAFLKLAADGPEIFQFRLSQVIGRPGLDQPDTIAQAVRDAVPILAEIRDPVERDVHIRRIGALLKVSPEPLYQALRQYEETLRKKPQVMDINSKSSHTKHGNEEQRIRPYSPVAPPGYPPRALLAERELLKAMVLSPRIAAEVKSPNLIFAIDLHDRLYRYIDSSCHSEGGLSLASWLASLDVAQARYVMEMTARAEEEASSGFQFDIQGCLARMEEGRILLRIHELEQEIITRETKGVLDTGEAELSGILAELRELHGQLRLKSSPPG